MRTILAIIFLTFATQASSNEAFSVGDVFYCEETANLDWASVKTKITNYTKAPFKFEVSDKNYITIKHSFMMNKTFKIELMKQNVLIAGDSENFGNGIVVPNSIIKLYGRKFVFVTVMLAGDVTPEVHATMITGTCDKF